MTWSKVFATNRQARFNYHILETLEAGAVLTGTEVKSLRLGRCNMKDSYATCRNGEVWLMNCHISPYEHGNRENHDPMRPRKLLLQRRQILKLERELIGGLTLVPLKVYAKGRHIKFEIGVARGKKLHDKRAALKEKAVRRETEAAMRGRRR